MYCYHHLTDVLVESSHNLLFLALIKRLFSMYDTRQYLEMEESINPGNTDCSNELTSQLVNFESHFEKKITHSHPGSVTVA